MSKVGTALPAILDDLESHYGLQVPDWPTDPYLFLVWWHCGYPQSDVACERGWMALNSLTTTDCDSLLKVSTPKLAAAIKVGGMVPELRAERLKEIAARVKDEFRGDLRQALVGPIAQVRKRLKTFPGIADPGADRILLFAGISPIAAVPSNCPHVVARLVSGNDSDNYSHQYKRAQAAIEDGVAATFDARTRAYLLLKRHGQETCKRTKPKCEACPVSGKCAYYAKVVNGNLRD